MSTNPSDGPGYVGCSRSPRLDQLLGRPVRSQTLAVVRSDDAPVEWQPRVSANQSLAECAVSVEGVRVRWTGHRLDASLQIVAIGDITVAKGDDISDQVTQALFRNVQLDDGIVEVDPDGVDRYHSITREMSRAAPGSEPPI